MASKDYSKYTLCEIFKNRKEVLNLEIRSKATWPFQKKPKCEGDVVEPLERLPIAY